MPRSTDRARTAYQVRCRGTRNAPAGPARPGASQRDRRASIAAREADRRPTNIARGATTRAQPSVRVRGSFTQGPSRSPRLARVRRPRTATSRAAMQAGSLIRVAARSQRVGTTIDAATATSHRRARIAEPAEIAGTRAGPQGCPRDVAAGNRIPAASRDCARRTDPDRTDRHRRTLSRPPAQGARVAAPRSARRGATSTRPPPRRRAADPLSCAASAVSPAGSPRLRLRRRSSTSAGNPRCTAMRSSHARDTRSSETS